MLLAKETRNFLKQKRLNVPAALTSNIIACIVRAVEEKLGAAFLPIAYVNRELNNKSLQAFGPQEGFWQHRLFLYAKREDISSSASSLAKVLQDYSATDFSINELETTA